MLKIACVIPARLHSTRFPQKILAPLNGKPLLQWAWQAAQKTNIFNDIVIAIDHETTTQIIKTFNGTYQMTSQKCQSGTDRLIEIMNSQTIDADIWVNWQADEPFITKPMIKELLQTCSNDHADVWTLKKQIQNKNEINDQNIVKVVCDTQGHALYFSRSTIPFYRNENMGIFYKHIGLYAYTTKALQKIARMPKSNLEEAEKLEQLRFLQNNLKIKVHETQTEVIGIDTREDLTKAQELLI